MKKSIQLAFLAFVVLTVLLSGCTPASTPVPPTSTPFPTSTPIPPTLTPTPTLVPSATATPIGTIDLNPETFRNLEWDYVTSPAYLAELEQKEQAGLLPKVPDNPSYVKPNSMRLIYYSATARLNKYGSENIAKILTDVDYYFVDNRPCVLVDIAKTNISGIKMVIYVMKWDNSDGTHGFIGHLIPNYEFIKLYGLDGLVGRKDGVYPIGTYLVRNGLVDGCMEFLRTFMGEDALAEKQADADNFCKYYYENPNIFLPRKTFETWKTSGNLITPTLPITTGGNTLTGLN